MPFRKGFRRKWLGWAAAGTALVLVASPALELITGSEILYAVALTGLLLCLWPASGLGRREVGFTSGRGYYRIAIVLPLLVVGVVVFLGTVADITRVDDTSLRTLAARVATMALVTALGSLIADEGFFRGWLWGSLERARVPPEAILVATSTAYALWYLPLVLIEPSFRLPAGQIPIYLLNLWLLGMCWGVLRLDSGSVLPAAVAHGVWNGLAYTLFGFGAGTGALGIADSARFDPERGWAGVALNTAAFLFLWRWWLAGERARRAAEKEEAAAGSGSGS